MEVVVVEDFPGVAMFEMVWVGHQRLMGEVVRCDSTGVFVHCYEATGGISVGDPVMRLHRPLEVELGPGLANCVFDGLQRPLKRIAAAERSPFMPRGGPER